MDSPSNIEEIIKETKEKIVANASCVDSHYIFAMGPGGTILEQIMEPILQSAFKQVHQLAIEECLEEVGKHRYEWDKGSYSGNSVGRAASASLVSLEYILMGKLK